MNFEYSEKVQTLRQNTNAFMEQFVYPNEARRAAEIRANLERGRPYADYPLLDELKEAARARGLVSVREQIESFESVSDPLLNSLNPLPFSPLFLNLGGCWGVDQ